MVAVVELREVRCFKCRALLCLAHLPAGSVTQHKCPKCSAVTILGGDGARVVMLTRLMAKVD